MLTGSPPAAGRRASPPQPQPPTSALARTRRQPTPIDVGSTATQPMPRSARGRTRPGRGGGRAPASPRGTSIVRGQVWRHRPSALAWSPRYVRPRRRGRGLASSRTGHGRGSDARRRRHRGGGDRRRRGGPASARPRRGRRRSSSRWSPCSRATGSWPTASSSRCSSCCPFVLIAVWDDVPSTGIKVVLLASCAVVLIYNVASMIALVRNYRRDSDFIYRRDVAHLRERAALRAAKAEPMSEIQRRRAIYEPPKQCGARPVRRLRDHPRAAHGRALRRDLLRPVVHRAPRRQDASDRSCRSPRRRRRSSRRSSTRTSSTSRASTSRSPTTERGPVRAVPDRDRSR